MRHTEWWTVFKKTIGEYMEVTFEIDTLNKILERVSGGAIKSEQDGVKYKMPSNGKITLSISDSNFQFPKWMGSCPRVNTPWTEEEEQELLRGYRELKLTIDELSKKHGRARGGILSRLEKWYPEIKEARESEIELKRLEHELDSLRKKANQITNEIITTQLKNNKSFL